MGDSPTDLQLLLEGIEPRSPEAIAILEHTKLDRSTIFRIKKGINKPRVKSAVLFVSYFGEEKLTIGGCFDSTQAEAKS